MGDDLIAWYETSLENSFNSSEIKNDGSSISKWKDSNKNAVNKNDATQTTDANKPSLYQNVFYNSIPGLRFSGAQYLNFDGTRFAKSSYTVFVVEQRAFAENGYYNSFISSPIRAPSKRLSLGYYGFTDILQSHFSNDTSTTIPSYKAQTPAIHTFVYSNTNGQQYSLNGKNPIASNDKILPLDSYDSANIGYHQGPSQAYYYKGDLAEIIMFKRSLKTEEVEAIESYLGSKYGIPVS
jgi:hypothetical protein